MIDAFYLALILIVILSSFGLSIGLAMICGSTVYLMAKGFDPSIASETLLQGLYDSYTLLAIPLFVLAADIMNVGSLADRLLRFCQALVGRYRGGLGYVNVVSAVIFSGMSGSAVADAVGMGRIIIGMMTKDGKYTPSYAAAITAAAATIGPIIPPSIPMVLYALVADQSVGYLFAAGMAPGLAMGLMIGVMNWWIARKRNFPVDEGVPMAELPGVTFKALPALMLPVILLGGIYGGVFTPTEGASVGAFVMLVIGLVRRTLTPAAVRQAILQTAETSAMIFAILLGAEVFNAFLALTQVPTAAAEMIAASGWAPYTVLIGLLLFYIVLGGVMDELAMILLTLPVFFPIVIALDFGMPADDVAIWFGILVLIVVGIGMTCPPIGLNVFVVASLARDVPVTQIYRGVLPFVAVDILRLGVVVAFPALTLYLVKLLE